MTEFALPRQTLSNGQLEELPPDDQAGPTTLTSLAALTAELTAELAPEEKTWEVPTRPGWSASYRLDLSEPDFDRAEKAATTKKATAGRAAEVAEVTRVQHLLARYNTAILKNGQLLLSDVDGAPLTFRSPEFQGIYGATRAIDAVKGFYGTDGALIATGRAFTQATGWLKEPDETDHDLPQEQAGPTRR